MYYPALIVFLITLIPLFFTKYLFVADWERPKDLNGIDARMIIFWGYIFGMVLPIGIVAFRGYIIQKHESPTDIFIVRSDICNCLLYTSPSPRDGLLSRMPSSA